MGLGSYDPVYTLHYVTLRIDPNKYSGALTSGYIDLEVNGIAIDSWANPIRLYGWGVPHDNDSVFDKYGIVAKNYKIEVKLTGLLSNDISITNVNLEGCFGDAHPCPEPATMFLLGSGLVGLAGFRRKKKK